MTKQNQKKGLIVGVIIAMLYFLFTAKSKTTVMSKSTPTIGASVIGEKKLFTPKPVIPSGVGVGAGAASASKGASVVTSKIEALPSPGVPMKKDSVVPLQLVAQPIVKGGIPSKTQFSSDVEKKNSCSRCV